MSSSQSSHTSSYTSSSSSKTHSLHIDKICETLIKKEFKLEKIYSENTSIKYLIFRHIVKGFQFVLYVSSKYEVLLNEKLDSINTMIIHESDEDEHTNYNNNYELMFGSYLDNTYNSLSLNTQITPLDFRRYMKSVSFNKNYGLFILTQFCLTHITYNRIRKYKPSISTLKHISNLPVISIEEIINWTSITSQTLENMIEKLWSLLQDINTKHASTISSLKDSLNTLESNKNKYDLKSIDLKTEYKKLINNINEVNNEIKKYNTEKNTNPNVHRQQTIQEQLMKNEMQLKKLFVRRTELENEINTYQLFMDEIIYRSHVCLSQLNDLITNISTFL